MRVLPAHAAQRCASESEWPCAALARPSAATRAVPSSLRRPLALTSTVKLVSARVHCEHVCTSHLRRCCAHRWHLSANCSASLLLPFTADPFRSTCAH